MQTSGKASIQPETAQPSLLGPGAWEPQETSAWAWPSRAEQRLPGGWARSCYWPTRPAGEERLAARAGHQRFLHVPGFVRLRTSVHLFSVRHECHPQPGVGLCEGALDMHPPPSLGPGLRGGLDDDLFASPDSRERGQRCLIHQASKGWTSEAWSRGTCCHPSATRATCLLWMSQPSQLGAL